MAYRRALEPTTNQGARVVKYYFALAAGLLCVCAGAAPPKDTAAGEQRFRELYKELVETNTTLSAGRRTHGGKTQGGRLPRQRPPPIRSTGSPQGRGARGGVPRTPSAAEGDPAA